jgi:4-carboxymuconolactone decarboxylase
VLFRDLWLRPGLAPRDWPGRADHLPSEPAMDNGLTKEEAGEVVGHLAFYAGWPNTFSAAPVVEDVIEKRPR